MNRDRLKKFIGGCLQLVPVAHQIDQDGRLLERIDDDWLLESVTDRGARISNPRTEHLTTLGFDHIYEFTSNPDRSHDEARYGFLTLKILLERKRAHDTTDIPTGRSSALRAAAAEI